MLSEVSEIKDPSPGLYHFQLKSGIIKKKWKNRYQDEECRSK